MQTPWLMPVVVYLATAVFLAGMVWRVRTWLSAKVPLNIVLTPGPVTTAGVLRRLAGEAMLFRSLFAADRSLWAGAWVFHVSLALLLIGHVCGLVIPGWIENTFRLSETQFHAMAQVTGGIFGVLAAGSLLWLLLRRLVAERVRHLSSFSDFFAPALLLLIIGGGNHMRFLGGLELDQAREFVKGLLTFHPVAPPADPTFSVHVLMVCALLVYIPFSKLMHLGGLFLSPTLSQTNTPREHRHVGPWGKPSRV